MVTAPSHHPADLGPLASRRLPPVTGVAIAVMALVLAGGVDIAAFLPRRPSLVAPTALLACAAVLLLANVVQLSRLRHFAWHVFRQVAGWSLVAYVVIAGMLEYVFVYDGTRGSLLVVLTAMIAVFAVDIPLMLGFAVARYQEPSPVS